MKIAIISDTHDNLAAVETVINELNKRQIELVLHAGDQVAPTMGKLWLERFLNEPNRKMITVWGNNDGEKVGWQQLAEESQGRLECAGEFWQGQLAGKNFFMIHDSALSVMMAQGGQFDYCIGGHDHRARREQFKQTTFINPGNLTIKRTGSFYKADDHCFGILTVETGEWERVEV